MLIPCASVVASWTIDLCKGVFLACLATTIDKAVDKRGLMRNFVFASDLTVGYLDPGVREIAGASLWLVRRFCRLENQRNDRLRFAIFDVAARPLGVRIGEHPEVECMGFGPPVVRHRKSSEMDSRADAVVAMSSRTMVTACLGMSLISDG